MHAQTLCKVVIHFQYFADILHKHRKVENLGPN